MFHLYKKRDYLVELYLEEAFPGHVKQVPFKQFNIANTMPQVQVNGEVSFKDWKKKKKKILEVTGVTGRGWGGGEFLWHRLLINIGIILD